MVKIDINAHYRLRNLQTGTYLTRADSDNVAIVGNRYNAENGQEWKFLQAGDDTFFIQAADADQFIAVPFRSVAQYQQLECNIAPFAWKVYAEEGMATVARFTPLGNPSLNFDLWEANDAEGTKILLHPRTGNNQLWLLEKVRRNSGEQDEHSHSVTVTVTEYNLKYMEEDVTLSGDDGVVNMAISKKSEFSFEENFKVLSIDGDEGNVDDEEGMAELPSVDDVEGNVELVVA